MAGDFDAVIDRVRNATDIVELIGRYVTLKKAGKDYKALCPFHKEKTPSFYVVPDKQIFHCFGCGASGNVFAFLMKYENITFMEALKRLAAEAGIELPTTPSARKQISDNERLYRANELALKFFQMELKRSPQARQYLQTRGIQPATIERYKLGWAPDAWDGLVKYIEKFNYPIQDFFRAGLLQKGERTNHYYDRFRGRLMFPILNPSEKVVAFGGRILKEDPNAPKYMNSPESTIYQKKQILYGLPQARQAIREQEFVIIVEGYMDVLQLAQVGIQHVVATSGTALTEEHARLLRRYTKKCVLCYDSDPAGVKAAMRGGQLLFNEGLETDVVLLPAGEDPDSLVRTKGADAFLEFLEHKQPYFDFLLQTLEEQYNLEIASQRSAAIDVALEALANIKDPFMSGFYVERLGNRWHVDIPLLLNALKRKKRQLQQQRQRQTTTESTSGETAASSTASASPSGSSPVMLAGAWRAERGLLVLLLTHYDMFAPVVSDKLFPEEFQNPEFANIYQYLLQLEAPLPEDIHQHILERLEDEHARNVFTEGLLQEFHQPEQHLVDCLMRIKIAHQNSQLKHLREELRTLTPGSEPFQSVMLQIQQTTRVLKELKSRFYRSHPGAPQK